MVYFTKIGFLFLIVTLLSCGPKKGSKSTNQWQGKLILNDSTAVPLKMVLNLNPTDSSITILNGGEALEFSVFSVANDLFLVKLHPFNSELRFTMEAEKLLGEWHNLVKGPNYKIDFSAVKKRFVTNDFSAANKTKYKVQFGIDQQQYDAILLLQQSEQNVRGTFKTETGDYRFLWGKQTEEGLVLTCFDGAHAFVFTAEPKADSLVNGVFYSGNHYTDTWAASLNGTFELTDPAQLTQPISDSVFRYNLKTVNGDIITEKNQDSAKVTCIQIMGTWCPNCKDETEFLKELRNKFSADDLTIFGAAFEYEKDTARALQRIANYSKTMNMNYPVYYGGGTSKKRVTDVFPDLDRVISYPTLIVLNKKGAPVYVHTGFNGPATDEYQQFVEDTYSLIDSLILN